MPNTKENGRLPALSDYDALRAGLQAHGMTADNALHLAGSLKAGIEALVAERDALREALERIAKSNPDLPPASRFVVIARAALAQSIDLEVANPE